MRSEKEVKHTAKDLTGCSWHSRIKKWSKRQASKNARRIRKIDIRKVV